MDEATVHFWIVIGWLVCSVPIFLLLIFVTAPYGRHARGGWGPKVKATWGWIVMETPSPLVFVLCALWGAWPPGPVEWCFIIMWLVHYVNRTYVYPFRMRTDRGMPLSVVVMAIVFNTMNGYINGRWIGALSEGWEVSWFVDPRFILGVAIFALGFAINLHSDAVLRGLRSRKSSGYSIPRGGLYEFVSCPNYLGEIMEWTGWAIATWSLPGLAFAVWTFANLAPRAISNHRWYREEFADYPRKRKALVPFVL